MIASPSASAQSPGVIAPYGGKLVDLMVATDQQEAVKASANHVLECSDRNACDLELLVGGGFSPERGFMHQGDYDAVVAGHRTLSGYLFGLPIVMDTDREDVAIGDRVLLSYKGQDLAVLQVEDKWEPDKVVEAKGCYGTTSLEHPAVRMIATERKRFYLGGTLQGLELPSVFSLARALLRFGRNFLPGRTLLPFSVAIPFIALTTSCLREPCMPAM